MVQFSWSQSKGLNVLVPEFFRSRLNLSSNGLDRINDFWSGQSDRSIWSGPV